MPSRVSIATRKGSLLKECIISSERENDDGEIIVQNFTEVNPFHCHNGLIS